jgi:hypothetical protein
MFHRVRFASVLFALTSCVTIADLVGAADNIRYVSITGKNANPCTLAQPCRSLQRGINLTPAGGELRILDSGDYGANGIIRKSMTVNGNGNTIFVTNGVVINNATAIVALHGLVLDGQGTAAIGVNIIAANTVRIERSVIHDYSGNGIVAAATGVKVFAFDVISRDNGGSGFNIVGTGSRVTIDNSRFENNAANGVNVASGFTAIHRSSASGNASNGIAASNSASVTVMSTVVAHNVASGFLANTASSITVESSLVHNNPGGSGLAVFNGGVGRTSNSTYTAHGTGLGNGGGTIETRENSTIRGNFNDISGAVVPIDGL